ncbi:MAG TPA: protein rep [Terracidiphilus sp.]|nr:protein rep [Terracidiphilus sp.]
MDSEGIPGLTRGYYIGRMENCAGFKSGCGSPYCPACSRRMFYALQRRLLSVVQDIPARELRFGTFTVADCSDMELRANLKFVTQCATDMLKAVPSLRGWFIRKEVSRSPSPGYYHPHLHVLMHVAPGYTSGRNTMSREKWSAEWMRAIPEELQVQGRPDYEPADVQSVTDVEGIVKYITKSPWHDAFGPRIEDGIDDAVEIDALLFAIARTRRYAASGTLKLPSRTKARSR